MGQFLLYLDLNSIFSSNSLSTQGAALISWFFFPFFLLKLFFIVCSTDVFSLFIHFLKEYFFPIFPLKLSRHICRHSACMRVCAPVCTCVRVFARVCARIRACARLCTRVRACT